MKFAFLTVDSQATTLAHHLQEEGNEVYVGVVRNWSDVQVRVKETEEARKKRLKLFDEMLKNKMPADRLMAFLLGQPRGRRDEWFIFTDFNWGWPLADRLRAAGFQGLLPTKEDYELEHDRKKAHDLIADRYPMIEQGEYHEFKRVDDADKFLSEHDGLYVLKGFNADAETVVPQSDDPGEGKTILRGSLERGKALYEKDGFILEEKITDVIEFTPEAISWNGEIVSVTVDLEHKRLGSRNGPMTGCAMDCVLDQRDNNELYQDFLSPLEDQMLRSDQLTIWDLSVLYSPSQDKFYAGEFCANRPGYNAIFTEAGMFPSVTEFFEHLMGGNVDHNPVGCSARIFNIDKKEELILCDPTEHGSWFFDIYSDGTNFWSTGIDKNAYVCTASGTEMNEILPRLYKQIDSIEFNSALSLQERDWFDTGFTENILHRKSILESEGVISAATFPLLHSQKN